MSRFRDIALRKLANLGPRYLPFADAATEELPLGRLLRLSLFQVTVGMALVLLVGTLNRVMIVELAVPATIVGVMVSLPLVFAPFRALIGFKSDIHTSALGWRRVPYIWKGTLLQFGGFAIMPFALLVLSGFAEAHDAPAWIGISGAALAFLLVGAGAHMVQTVGLALATDLAPPEDQPKVVGLMYVMMLLGMGASALVFGWLLDPYTPARLVQVIQGAAVVTAALNILALWKQEARDRKRAMTPTVKPDFNESWRDFVRGIGTRTRLVAIGLGTTGFGMADVILEPFGGQVLDMTVSGTTKLTAALAAGGLVGFALASKVLTNGYSPLRLARIGAVAGIPGFVAIIMAAPMDSLALLVAGTTLTGFGAGLFGHGTLTETMRAAPKQHIGLALGAWGAVQATCAGVAVTIGGAIRDIILAMPISAEYGAATPYYPVFAIEIVLLILALAVMQPLISRGIAVAGRQPAE